MRISFSALVGAVIISTAHAQVDQTFNAGPNLSDDPVVATQQIQQQKQFEFDNARAELQSQANQAKEGLLSRRTQLTRELQQCYINFNEQGIEAGRQADQAEQAATQQMVNSVPQALTPLMQSFDSGNKAAKAEAEEELETAVQNQVSLARRFFGCTANMANLPPGKQNLTAITVDPEGSNAAIVLANVNLAASAVTSDANCTSLGGSLTQATSQVRIAANRKKRVDSSANGNLMNTAAAAGMLGINAWTMSGAKKSAQEGLADAKRVNALNYDACKQGVTDETAEVDRQLANIDRQLASDLDRLARQYAMFKVNLPANIQNRNLLDVADSSNDLPLIGNVGNSVAGTKFAPINNPFGNLNAGGDSGSPTGSGGSPGGGIGDSEKAGWGFRDPYETSSPGMGFTLPPQPDKAGLIAGVGEGGFGGGMGEGEGLDPFGPGFLGFEDPFANVGKDVALAKTGGNGFWELAQKTNRVVNAHIRELLGTPSGTRVSKEKDKTLPERKISSVRD